MIGRHDKSEGWRISEHKPDEMAGFFNLRARGYDDHVLASVTSFEPFYAAGICSAKREA